MYAEKFEQLFRRYPGCESRVTDNVKNMISYVNHVIEETMLSQAYRYTGDIRENMQKINEMELKRKNLHDIACEACAAINNIAKEVELPEIFPFRSGELEVINDRFQKYSPDNHGECAVYISELMNEYYDLGLEIERNKTGIDKVFEAKMPKVSEARLADMALGDNFPAYSKVKADFIRKNTNRIMENRREAADIFVDLIKNNFGGRSIVLDNGIELYVEPEDNEKSNGLISKISGKQPTEIQNFIVKIKSTNGLNLQSENIFPKGIKEFFQIDGTRDKMVARDMVAGQIKDIIVFNGLKKDLSVSMDLER